MTTIPIFNPQWKSSSIAKLLKNGLFMFSPNFSLSVDRKVRDFGPAASLLTLTYTAMSLVPLLFLQTMYATVYDWIILIQCRTV